MKDWKKGILALLSILVMVAIGLPTVVKAAGTPAPTVTKKTLYVGYENYTVRMKNLGKGSKVTYTSSDKKVATVSSKGVISPVAAGKATITVKTVQSGKTYTSKIAVTVKNPSVNITEKIAVITAGMSYHFEGKTYGLKNAAMSWASSDEKVATISASGRLEAIAAGTAKITYKDRTSGKSASYKVKVVEKPDDWDDFLISGGTLSKYCGTKKNVIIPEGVTGIGNWAFFGCGSLGNVTIPNSVASIGEYAFSGCDSLGSVTIPDSVMSIGDGAFEDCKSLGSVTISNGVTSIGWHAFEGCSSLGSVTIPNSVTSIGDGAFENCDSLGSVTIPNSVTSIGDYAFCGCGSLGSVTIPNSITSIGDGVFEDCKSLGSVTIPDSVTSIGEEAFKDCKSLGSVTIPDSVTSIGEEAFKDCKSLGSITIPDSVVYIGEKAFLGTLWLEEQRERNVLVIVNGILVDGVKGSGEVKIPKGVTSIGEEAFKDCGSLSGITIPDSVTSIGEEAFKNCGSLGSVTIPNSVTYIGVRAFSGCKSLGSVTIPNSVTYIGWNAFQTVDNTITLYVTAGSYAERYAKENGIPYKTK